VQIEEGFAATAGYLSVVIAACKHLSTIGADNMDTRILLDIYMASKNIIGE
jgi:hypothetical protein